MAHLLWHPVSALRTGEGSIGARHGTDIECDADRQGSGPKGVSLYPPALGLDHHPHCHGEWIHGLPTGHHHLRDDVCRTRAAGPVGKTLWRHGGNSHHCPVGHHDIRQDRTRAGEGPAPPADGANGESQDKAAQDPGGSFRGPPRHMEVAHREVYQPGGRPGQQGEPARQGLTEELLPHSHSLIGHRGKGTGQFDRTRRTRTGILRLHLCHHHRGAGHHRGSVRRLALRLPPLPSRHHRQPM